MDLTILLFAQGINTMLLKTFLKIKKKFPNVKVINTGLNTETGGRIFKLRKHLIKEKNFF